MNTDTCEHKFVTEIETEIEDYEHPLICDDCNAIIECEHNYELSDENGPYCWVCGDQPKEDE